MRTSRHLHLLSLLLLGLFITACGERGVPEASGQLELRNLIADVGGETPPGFFNDWLTMSRIARVPTDPDEDNGRAAWENLKFQDTAVLRLSNLSTEEPLYLTRLAVDTVAFTLPQRPELPLEIAPGGAFELTVKFTASQGERGVRRGALAVGSSGGSAQVQLAGVFMERPEGNDEVNLQQIVDAFGYTTDIGLEGERLSESPDDVPAGDEVRASFWERANPGEPIYVRQLAAYHGCCDEENFIELLGRSGESLGSFFHAASYGQSVLPPISGETGPAELVLPPTSAGAFEIVVGAVGDTYSTNTDGNLGVRLWPVVGRDGEVIADAYIVAEDYVQQGCGEGFANCDYQDNVFLITNVRPVTEPAQ